MSNPTEKVDTSELEKLSAVVDKSHQIGEFLEWCGEQGYSLCTWSEDDELIPTHKTIEQLLADFFEIDLKKVEEQRSALLDSLR